MSHGTAPIEVHEIEWFVQTGGARGRRRPPCFGQAASEIIVGMTGNVVTVGGRRSSAVSVGSFAADTLAPLARLVCCDRGGIAGVKLKSAVEVRGINKSRLKLLRLVCGMREFRARSVGLKRTSDV